MDAWLERSAAKGLPRYELLDLFEAALLAIWARTRTTVGEVTLSLAADRVLHNVAGRSSVFASLTVEPNGRIQARALREDNALHHMKVVDGMRALLVEFLSVLGTLTADVLTPELHAELSSVAPDPAAGRLMAACALAHLGQRRPT